MTRPSLAGIEKRAARTGKCVDDETAVPALTAAVRDVLALHREGGEVLGYDAEGVLDYIPACVECDQTWPCPTVRALAAHLDLTDPEGDST